MSTFATIYKLVKPYKGLAALNFIFNTMSSLFALASLGMIYPLLQLLFNQKEVVSDPPISINGPAEIVEYAFYLLGQVVEKEGKIEALFILCVTIVVMFFFKNLFRYLAVYVLSPLRIGVVKDVRMRAYKKLLRLPILYYTESKKGDLMARMSADVQEVEWSVMSSVEILFKEPFNLIGTLTILLFISPKLMLFAFVLLPVAGLVIGKLGNKLKKYSEIGQGKLGMVLTVIEETLSGLKVIKAFNSEERELNKFDARHADYNRQLIDIYRMRELASPLTEFLGIMVVAIVMWFGGNMVLGIDAAISAAAFINFVTFFSQIIPPAKAMSSAWFNIKRGMGAYDRIEDITQSDELITDVDDPEELISFQEKIEFRNVSFAYQTEKVLDDISLTIEKGKTIALVGPSGGGKSTLADLIPRFFDPVEGKVIIDAKDIRNCRVKDVRSLMGIVSQQSILFNDTVYNNIAFGVDVATKEEVIEAAKIANAHEFILALENNYQYNIGDGGTRLSGGQRQRISIARAILKNPAILILDEATSSLDTESERAVQDAIDKLMHNRTAIVIAHRLSTIQKADAIVVIEKGKIIEQGKHEELLAKKGVYSKLSELQGF